jgi:hypothetical protein
LLPLATWLARAFRGIRLPLSSYLDLDKLIDTAGASREVQTRLVQGGYGHDPDFDRWNPLRAILSLVSTPPARIRDLYDRLPAIRKATVEVDGGVVWMLSHPGEAAALACGWFDETV